MHKTTLTCFWWLRSQNFKIIVESLSVKLKIGVLKVLMLMAIKLKNSYSVLKISSNELSLDPKVIAGTLYWLSKIKVIVLINDGNLISSEEYLIKYSSQEIELRNLYDDCWVELPNRKILQILKNSPNDQILTYDALKNYLMLLKGYRENKCKAKPIYFDEELLNGHFKGTWREVLVHYELIEFWGLNNLLNNG